MPDDITIYRPNQRHELGLFRTWVVMAGNVWASRGLIWQLFKRDFVAAYRKSFIGVTWVVITPLIGIVSWVFLQLTGLLQPGDVGIPYPAYVLVGTSMFGLFMKMYYAASGTFNAGKDLIMQVNYPHEALLFQQVGQQIADFLITLAVNLVVLLAFRVVPSPGLILLPVVALPLMLLATAAGLMIAMVGVVAIDLRKLVDLCMAFLMYFTPVIYSSTVANRWVQAAITWNPLTYLVCSCRDMVIAGRLYHPAGYAWSSLLAVVLFLLSWRMFYVSEDTLVERMI